MGLATGKICSHDSILCFTLYKWHKRYQLMRKEGLYDISSKPKISPFQKRSEPDEKLILNLRKERNLAARRIQSEF